MFERDTRLYIEDMLEFCGKALAYSSALTEATLTVDAMRYDAILRNLELIGEAATRVPEALRAMAPGVPWRQIVATRNRVAHAYLGISADTVWSILHDDLPALDLALRALLTRMNQEPPATGR
ncbi:DUF86 domain-containing protein [Roseateles sp.]|uniref:HepT-like ribonuclease domain-containing protein n=1 Tax=Roseateles sp. TaxID=1971397 RepID=UPI003263FA2F